MSHNDKDKHRERYYRGAAREDLHKQNRQQKEKARKRGEVESRGKRVRRRDWEDADDELIESWEKIKNRSTQLGSQEDRGTAESEATSSANAVVTGVDRDGVRLDFGDQSVKARTSIPVVVGDEVELRQLAQDQYSIVGLARRRSFLSRPDPSHPERERILAANVDLALCVLAIKEPGLKLGLFDRFHLACARGGVEAALVINKIDLLSNEEERREVLSLLDRFAQLDSPIHLVSSESGEGMEGLRALIQGRSCVFAGHSGVGKSSLLNALAPTSYQKIGAVRESDGKGRHTTVSSNLISWPDGTRLIDTPGVRAFGMAKLSARELQLYFPEFQGLSQPCRYKDCLHQQEPDCGIRREVELGRIHASRYETYLRLLSETS